MGFLEVKLTEVWGTPKTGLTGILFSLELIHTQPPGQSHILHVSPQLQCLLPVGSGSLSSPSVFRLVVRIVPSVLGWI